MVVYINYCIHSIYGVVFMYLRSNHPVDYMYTEPHNMVVNAKELGNGWYKICRVQYGKIRNQFPNGFNGDGFVEKKNNEYLLWCRD